MEEFINAYEHSKSKKNQMNEIKKIQKKNLRKIIINSQTKKQKKIIKNNAENNKIK